MSSDNTRPALTELFSRSRTDIISFLSGVYENSPWVAEQLLSLVESDDKLKSTVTSSVVDLATGMKQIVNESSREQQLELLCAHPDLCEKVSNLQTLTKHSQEEQSRAGLQTLTDEERTKFLQWNDMYRTKFGFPFILAVRNATKYTVLSSIEGRVGNSIQVEFATALQQVHKIAWMRLLSSIRIVEPKGFLTCHVLDTANGCPAANMRIQLHRLSPPEHAGFINEFHTNSDGRLPDGPALKGSDFMVGTYEWTFYVGDYFARTNVFTSGTPFLDVIPLRFGIDNPEDHYHVPLLTSPWSFSTYRGS